MHRSSLLQLFAFVALVGIVLGSSTVAMANPPGIPAGWHKVWQFNMIGYPAGQEYTGNCGHGNRVFVNRDAHSAKMLVTDGGSWDIVDCNATSDHWAEMTTNDAASYAVFVRILGRPGGHIDICADTYEDYMLGETLCLLGTIDLTRGHGRSQFSMAPSSMFDASLEDIVWQIDTNPDFRIVQFRVYEMP